MLIKVENTDQDRFQSDINQYGKAWRTIEVIDTESGIRYKAEIRVDPSGNMINNDIYVYIYGLYKDRVEYRGRSAFEFWQQLEGLL